MIIPTERHQPPPFTKQSGIIGKVSFSLRCVFDLQFFTIRNDFMIWSKVLAGNVLDVGCGAQPYKPLISPDIEYSAIDKKTLSNDFKYFEKDIIYYDADQFPIGEGAFNNLFHTEVLEHVFDVKCFLSECHRVLKIDGRMFFTVPFSARNHYIPNDYWRFTPSCLQKLLSEAGFKDVVVFPRGTDITVAVLKINSIFYRKIFQSYENPCLMAINKLFWAVLFVMPIIFLTVIAHIFLCLRIGSMDDPLGYTVWCRK